MEGGDEGMPLIGFIWNHVATSLHNLLVPREK